MTLVVSFPGTAQTTPAEVGGKGLSLIRMTEAGLRVPRGAVLTTSFFEPWFEELRASAQWTALATSSRDEWGAVTEALKELCSALPLTERQGEALKELRKSLAGPGQEALFAVRSSSPEEDLASASFAGGYETRLGVRSQGLEAAVRHCFASSLDERVLVYKREHGFDVLAPRIAIVVQQQIDSEVAGVGFSLNPLSNDYDEAVIDANWGLGESVVAGRASPDHFVVDRVDRRVLERTLGCEAGVHLARSERWNARTAEPPLGGEHSARRAGQRADRRAVPDRGALRAADGHRVGLRRRRALRAPGAPDHGLGSASTRDADEAGRTTAAVHGRSALGRVDDQRSHLADGARLGGRRAARSVRAAGRLAVSERHSSVRPLLYRRVPGVHEPVRAVVAREPEGAGRERRLLRQRAPGRDAGQRRPEGATARQRNRRTCASGR